ncbi:hypothetical protein BaRGS_00032247 [Batillaria attramentaria]|uniref:Prokineticin domain-containing protein n=1 Tax=Batillaria attramentaria TaxID=370345 RepID=A0ABD0JNY5_9CAEN
MFTVGSAQGSPFDPFSGLDDASCMSSSECAPGMCCARFNHSRRTRRFVNSLFQSGTCQPLLMRSQGCWDWQVEEENGDLYDYCPCAAGLECRGEQVMHVEGNTIHINPICQPRK